MFFTKKDINEFGYASLLRHLMIYISLAWVNNACAEWKKISQSQGYVINYIDPSTKKKTERDTITIWSKSEYQRPNEAGWRSAAGLLEADCRLGRSRLIALVAFEKSNLSGKKLHQEIDNFPWSKADPDTNATLLLAEVC
jgi:hypothetical protein